MINHSEISLVFCSSNHITDLIKSSENCPSLKMIVSFDSLDQSTKASFKEMASQKGLEVLEMKESELHIRVNVTSGRSLTVILLSSWVSVEADGRKNPVQPIKPTLDQLAAVSYTSGTTGDPKGT